MHPGQLAILPYMVLTIAALATAVMLTVATYLNIRPWFSLVGAAGFTIMAVGFALIAITAGDNPVLLRRNVAEPIRIIMLVGGIVWCAWLVLFAASLIHVSRETKHD